MRELQIPPSQNENIIIVLRENQITGEEEYTVKEMRISEIEKLKKDADRISNKAFLIAEEELRVANILQNIDDIVDDLDYEFSRRTGITNKKDLSFIFVAVMLQSLRWIISPDLDALKIYTQDLNKSLNVSKEDRMENNEKHKGGKYDEKKSGRTYENEEINKYLAKHKNKANESRKEYHGNKGRDTEYRTWIEIILRAVPYDAMNSDGNGIIPNICGLNSFDPKTGTYANLSPKNHHTATLGHDPVLGWIFGTGNIMSSTITFANYFTYEVVQENEQLDKWKQSINYTKPYPLFQLFEYCYNSAREDSKRIPAAVIRQSWHMTSDKYCKQGLPLPFLSSFNPERAQKLIEEGWNSEELKVLAKADFKTIGINAIISILINLIIKSIYLFCIDDNEDFRIKETRIQKILLVSNSIASTSNVVYVAVTKNLGKLDIGGIGVTLLELFKTTRFINEVKIEYIRNGIEQEIIGKDSWLDIVMQGDYQNV